MNKITKYIILDILKSKVVIVYMLLMFTTAIALFSLDDNSQKGLLSLLNIILYLVPIICLIYPTTYLFNSSEFIELLLSQPVSRSKIIASIYSGVVYSLVSAYLIGIGLPVLIYSPDTTGFLFLLTGVVLTFIFTSLSFLVTIMTRDKSQGIGLAVFLWFFFSIIYDGLLLLITFQWSDYPIEKLIMVFTAFNPVDLSRIFILIHTDYAAMMGYSGALFNEFLGSNTGSVIILIALIFWAIVPARIAWLKFRKKDL